MPIPEFTEQGLLPSGVYNCTLDEAREKFAINEHRSGLWVKLNSAIREMIEAGLTGILIIDGSFVTDKTIPGDIEIVLDVSQEIEAQQGLALLFLQRTHHRFKMDYDVDWYVNLPCKIENDFTTFFQYVGEKTAKAKNISPKDLKGILRIEAWI